MQLSYDISGHPSPDVSGPPLHHFRSSTLTSEQEYLKECWNTCLQKRTTLPASVIRIDHDNGSTERIHTGYFGGQIAQQVERTSKTCDHVPENTIPDSNDEEKGECDAAHEEVICISLSGDESIDLADKSEEST